MKLSKLQMKLKAYEVAAGLIDVMDLSKFWGDEIADSPANSEEDLRHFQNQVVNYLRKAAGR